MCFDAFDALVEVSWSLKLSLRFWAIKFFKNRIFGIMVPLRIPRVPCVENAFRKFEHVRITGMVIEEVRVWSKWFYCAF